MGKKDKLLDIDKMFKNQKCNKTTSDHELVKLINSDEDSLSKFLKSSSQNFHKLESYDDEEYRYPFKINRCIKDSEVDGIDKLEDAKITFTEGIESEDKEGNNLKKKAKKLSVYEIFKMVIKRYTFKCWCGELYVYFEKEGRFIRLPENKIKVLSRTGWDEKIQAKLTRNVVIEIMDRLLTEPSFQVEGDCFNKNTRLMNFLNGVLDLENKKFMRHSSDFMFTNCIQANYYETPKGGYTFREFIKTSMENDTEKIEHIQEVIGYMLSEFYSAKKVPMIIGQPHSGKSTLNRIITTLIGASSVASVPLHKLHERFILSHLSTKKANICSEISDEALSNIEVFKAITGNDDLVAEYKGKDHFTYKSKIKLLFSGNCMPVLKNQDITTAFFDRLTFINFNFTIPQEKRDKDLDFRILSEDKEYIVWWAVEGVKRLMNNNFIFSETDESYEFKRKYISEQNHIKDFIKNNCKIGNNYKVHLRELYDYYLSYCYSNCFTPLKKDSLFNAISKEKVEKSKFRIDKSNPLWGYIGITIKTDEELKCS